MALVDPTGIVGGIAGYGVTILLDRLRTEAEYIINCRDNCKTLAEVLGKIRPMVVEAEGRLPGDGSAVKAWLVDLQKVLEETAAIVSECNKVKKHQFIELSKMSKKISKRTVKIVEICTTQAPIVSLNIGAQTCQDLNVFKQKALAQLHDIIQILQAGLRAQDEKLGRIEGKLEDMDASAAAPKIFCTPRQVQKETFGMDEHLEELQGLLVGETGNENTKWIGVCGRGGMGKTLLATRAYNSKAIQDHFEQNIYWITVAEKKPTENIRSIELELLQKLGEKLGVRTKNGEPEEVKGDLYKVLYDRKVLLIIDDVWDDGFNVLDLLDVTSDDTGSKILVTTRDEKVLRKKKKQEKYILRMEDLSSNDSRKLFRYFAFTDGVPTKQLEELGNHIADECKGLPLALKVIAGAVAGQESPQEWERILECLKKAEKVSAEQEIKLYRRLQLSYDFNGHRRRHHLQKCFVYFAAYPEDSDVDSEKLVNLWIAENLANDRPDGYYLLDVLIGRSLIDIRKEEWSDNYKYRRLTCRIHDVLRDFARHLIWEERAPMNCLFRAGEGLTKFPDEWLTPVHPSEATHLSFNNNPLQSLPNELNAPRLEVLLSAHNQWSQRGFGFEMHLVIPPSNVDAYHMCDKMGLSREDITTRERKGKTFLLLGCHFLGASSLVNYGLAKEVSSPVAHSRLGCDFSNVLCLRHAQGHDFHYIGRIGVNKIESS